jgi:hypothetical protein
LKRSINEDGAHRAFAEKPLDAVTAESMSYEAFLPPLLRNRLRLNYFLLGFYLLRAPNFLHQFCLEGLRVAKASKRPPRKVGNGQQLRNRFLTVRAVINVLRYERVLVVAKLAVKISLKQLFIIWTRHAKPPQEV